MKVEITRGLSLGGGLGDAEGGSVQRAPLVLLDATDLEERCFGIVGASSRFCLGLKLCGKDHCGVTAHAKKKYDPKAGHLYPPGGVSNGQDTARFDVEVPISSVPSDRLVELRAGQFSPREATHALIEVAVPDPEDLVETWESFNKAGLKAEVAIKDDPEDDDWGDMSLLDVASLDSSRSQLVWADKLEEEEFDDKSWAPTALLHRSKLEALHDAVAGVGDSVPRLISKIDGDIRLNLKSARAEVGALKKDGMALQSVLGDLMGVVAAHGDLASTVSHLLSKAVDHDGELAALDSELFRLSTSVTKTDNKLDSLTGKLLSVITKVQRSCNTKISLIEDRMKALEGA